MANICCAWELGGGMGHVHALSILGAALDEADHHVSYILQDKKVISHFLNLDEKSVFTAPQWVMQKKNKLPWPIVNYTEVLMHRGYFKEEVLFELCRRWRNLLISNKADLLIVDHAPTALLAAYSLGIKCISIGVSFCSPVRETPFPIFREKTSIDPIKINAEEKTILATVNKVLTRFDAAPLECMAAIFSYLEMDLLTTFPELDAYSQRIDGDYVGPVLQNNKQALSVRWSNKYSKRIFAYLKKDFKYLDILLYELSMLETEIIIYIDGYKNKLEKLTEYENVFISPDPLDLNLLLPKVDAVVCHAGHGLVAESLLKGKPLLLIPLVMEQGLTSQRVEKLNAGIGIKTHGFKDSIKAALAKIIADDEYKYNAELFAKRYESYDREEMIKKLIIKCEECVSV